MIAIAIDIDWAHEELILDTLDILSQFNAKATIFATHESKALKNDHKHELAIHPNFLNTTKYEKILQQLLSLYPEAKGVSAHSHHQNTHILNLYKKNGLVYDTSLFMFCEKDIKPFHHWNGLIRLPLFWADDINATLGYAWDPSKLPMRNDKSLYIFTFHPIHIYLNTENIERYQEAKAFYKEPAKLKKYINPESTGIGARVFLKRLLDNGGEFMTLTDIIKSLNLGERSNKAIN